jgi:hypothetical protein
MTQNRSNIAFLLACNIFLAGLAYGEPGANEISGFNSSTSTNCLEAQKNQDSLVNSIPKVLCSEEGTNKEVIDNFLNSVTTKNNTTGGSTPPIKVEKTPALSPSNRRRDNANKRNSRTNGKAIAPSALAKSESEKTAVRYLDNSAYFSYRVIITDKMLPGVIKITKSYKKDTGRKLGINSGKRTPGSQAGAMFGRFKKLGVVRVKSIYKNKKAFDEIADGYRQHLNNSPAAINAMARIIERQVASGIYISRHLRGGSIDVNRNADSAALKKAVRQAGGTCFFEVDHYHCDLNPNG